MSEKTEIPLTGSFILQPESERYQVIFASQNYGTFYAFYAKLNFAKDHLESIDFKLVNYKGIINLGFLNNNDRGIKFDFSPETGTLDIEIIIKGLTQNYETNKLYIGESISANDIKNIFIARKLKRMANNGSEIDGVFDNEFHYRSGNIKNERKPRVSWEEENQKIDFEKKAFDGNCDFSKLETK